MSAAPLLYNLLGAAFSPQQSQGFGVHEITPDDYLNHYNDTNSVNYSDADEARTNGVPIPSASTYHDAKGNELAPDSPQVKDYLKNGDKPFENPGFLTRAFNSEGANMARQANFNWNARPADAQQNYDTNVRLGSETLNRLPSSMRPDGYSVDQLEAMKSPVTPEGQIDFRRSLSNLSGGLSSTQSATDLTRAGTDLSNAKFASGVTPLIHDTANKQYQTENVNAGGSLNRAPIVNTTLDTLAKNEQGIATAHNIALPEEAQTIVADAINKVRSATGPQRKQIDYVNNQLTAELQRQPTELETLDAMSKAGLLDAKTSLALSQNKNANTSHIVNSQNNNILAGENDSRGNLLRSIYQQPATNILGIDPSGNMVRNPYAISPMQQSMAGMQDLNGGTFKTSQSTDGGIRLSSGLTLPTTPQSTPTKEQSSNSDNGKAEKPTLPISMKLSDMPSSLKEMFNVINENKTPADGGYALTKVDGLLADEIAKEAGIKLDDDRLLINQSIFHRRPSSLFGNSITATNQLPDLHGHTAMDYFKKLPESTQRNMVRNAIIKSGLLDH